MYLGKNYRKEGISEEMIQGQFSSIVKRKRLVDQQFEQLKAHVDVGDILGAKGTEKRTKKKRYVDMIANPEVADVFRKRAKVVSGIRRTIDSLGYVEVESPVLQGAAEGAEARPFVTYHNSLGRDLYLRIATELHLKRTLVDGFEKVFEIGRIFRNEEISTCHNPEFTTIEVFFDLAHLCLQH
ncbi:lysine--tRNA ligase, chloroplastic/mitochondrial-like isoform X1 [Vicia villosa]|uniref:lysine--tRNA ligase, chloroplastic/mitochondrial-like isoform X1 n=2 Tax=Vicia villosa TaxID=3911 RepID=UPI00273B641B|nr:lysine--tRNA ligase, chloroplastic/mitochondrial-like isoform X1 [Vicia villosa]